MAPRVSLFILPALLGWLQLCEAQCAEVYQVPREQCTIDFNQIADFEYVAPMKRLDGWRQGLGRCAPPYQFGVQCVYTGVNLQVTTTKVVASATIGNDWFEAPFTGLPVSSLLPGQNVACVVDNTQFAFADTIPLQTSLSTTTAAAITLTVSSTPSTTTTSTITATNTVDVTVTPPVQVSTVITATQTVHARIPTITKVITISIPPRTAHQNTVTTQTTTLTCLPAGRGSIFLHRAIDHAENILERQAAVVESATCYQDTPTVTETIIATLTFPTTTVTDTTVTETITTNLVTADPSTTFVSARATVTVTPKLTATRWTWTVVRGTTTTVTQTYTVQRTVTPPHLTVCGGTKTTKPVSPITTVNGPNGCYCLGDHCAQSRAGFE